MSRKLFATAVASAALAAAPAVATAAPSGPEGPATCSFAGGITTCAHTGAPVTSTTSSSPDQTTGCITTTTATTVTTTYSAHRGTYNSDGVALPAPGSTTQIVSSTSSQECPTGRGQAACQAAGYRWSGPGPMVLEDYSGSFTSEGADFSCGEGSSLTLEQASVVGQQLVEPACNAVDAVTTVGQDPTGSGYVAACWGSQ